MRETFSEPLGPSLLPCWPHSPHMALIRRDGRNPMESDPQEKMMLMERPVEELRLCTHDSAVLQRYL